MAYTSHGHHIPGTDASNEPVLKARCGGPSLCSTCAREAHDIMSKLPKSNEHHDDDTIIKVHEALTKAVGAFLAHEAIREMQNAGILFRERA